MAYFWGERDYSINKWFNFVFKCMEKKVDTYYICTFISLTHGYDKFLPER